MVKNLRNIKPSYYLVYFALILFYISDALNKFLQIRQYTINDNAFENTTSISIYVRLLFELLFIVVIISNLDLIRIRVLFVILLLIIIFILGEVLFLLKFKDPIHSIPYHFTLLNKYLYAIIIYAGTYQIINNWSKYNKLLIVFEYIVIINSIFIFIGILLNIDLLKSYYAQDNRYGFDGLLPTVNEATLFYLIAISYFYYKHFVLGEKSWKFYLVILGSLLIGTKTIFLFLFLLIIYYQRSNITVLKRTVYLTLISLLIFFLGIFIYSRSEFSYLFASFVYFYENEGLLFMITSGRSEFVQHKFFENLDHWNICNYFLGGTDQLKYMIEMDFFDLFLFLGLIGFLLYLFIYFKTIFQNKLNVKFFSFFTYCYFLSAFLSGHIFASATNALNLILVCGYLKYSKFYKI